MDLQEEIRKMHAEFSGFNPPAEAGALDQLAQVFGVLPEQALVLYRDHNGSGRLPQGEQGRLAARLLPVAEVIRMRSGGMTLHSSLPTVAPVAWLWTDDNSNYCGLFTGGPLRGWLCVLDHDEPLLTPAFRSIASFVSRLLQEGCKGKEQIRAGDIPSMPPEIPAPGPEASYAAQDLQLAEHFRELYRNEWNSALRRLYAHCSICLTPFEKTAEVLQFLEDPDMWTPEAAVRLLELRCWSGATEELEKLAREGRANGDSAAMRLLARMSTDESRQAIGRLKQSLQGQKLKTLEMLCRLSSQPQP